MRFGRDDDILLTRLFNDLDIDSALFRLRRIGFKLISSSQKHHLHRLRDNVTEELFIEVNERNHFIIQCASNGCTAAYVDYITTWGEWVEFVRLLLSAKCKRFKAP
jgi:hypothetical protein